MPSKPRHGASEMTAGLLQPLSSGLCLHSLLFRPGGCSRRLRSVRARMRNKDTDLTQACLLYTSQAVDFLNGKPLSPGNIDKAAQLLSESTECLSDRYASAEYRSNLIRIETRRALIALSS